jgi:hypothetical protein
MSTTTIFYMGKVKELHSSIGGPAYPSDVPGHFTLTPPVTIPYQGQIHTFTEISVGPYFSGSLSFDKNIPHDGKFNIFFSSGHEAYGLDCLSLIVNPQKIELNANGWFKPHQDDALLFCDPVVYFTFDRKTKHGKIRFEFTDLWSGVLECTIDCFDKRS